jgi:hypothetical protein
MALPVSDGIAALAALADARLAFRIENIGMYDEWHLKDEEITLANFV